MKRTLALTLVLLTASLNLFAQGPRPSDLGPSPQPIGASGIMWYTNWATALEEAKRSNRPIFFMSAAAQCSSVSGVF